jgi:hypothetical protein
VYLGTEARALGHGGIAAVARAAGVSETMVAAGVAEVEAGELEELPPGRSRRAGGGRKKADDAGRITLYGIYDIAANRGFVSVGTSCDTAAFAVNALRLWWQRESLARYPGARRLLVTCDAGSSNGYRCRLWKDQLAVLAAETGLAITVCHFPPGTSKWNKIEHRLFCHITRTWRARPLMTVNDAVAGIAATVTGQGLKCTAVLDDADYPGGVKISDQQMDYLEDRILDRYGTRGEWNYAVLPAPRPAPEPGPAPPPDPGPDLAALAALAALLDAVAVPFAAAREQRLHLDRGHGRRKASGGAQKRLPFETIVTAAACHLRLRMPYRLLEEILGVHESTISLAARRVTPLLAAHGITRQDGGTRITTLAQLREHAAAAGITLTLPDPAGHEHPASATRPKLIADVSESG